MGQIIEYARLTQEGGSDMNGQIRQGDVLLDPVEMAPPEGARTGAEVVLALGEATGHRHMLRGRVVLEWEVSGQRYVRVAGDDPGTLQHEDHDPVPAAVVAPEQTYRVVPQRELDLSGQWVVVHD